MGGGGQFGSLREAYIPNHSLLLCLEALEKFLVVGGWGGVVQTSFRVQLESS